MIWIGLLIFVIGLEYAWSISVEFALYYVGGVLLATFIVNEILLWIERWEGRRRNKPLFVVTKNPETGKKVVFKNDLLDRYCVHVDYSDARAELLKLEKWYQEIGNPFFKEGLSDRAKMPRMKLIFQDGERINESWDDFEKFCEETIQEVTSDWYRRLKIDEDWFDENVNMQRMS